MVDLVSAPTVQAEGLPGRPYPRFPDEVSPASIGAGVGQAVENAGSIAQQVTDRAMTQARQTQLTDAHNQLQTLSIGLTHDPQTGALTKEGKDAFGITPQYLSQYDEQSQKIIGNVPDPIARQRALLASVQVRNQLTEQLETHELSQHQKFGVDTAKASIGLAQQAAVANFNHPDIIATNKDHIDASIDNLAQQSGWSDDQTKEFKYEAHSQLNQGVLQSMLADKKPELASAYLDSVRSELKPNEVAMAEKAIKGGQVDAAIQPLTAAYQVGTSAGEKALASFQRNSTLDADQKAQVIEGLEKQRNAFTYAQAQKYDKQLTSLYTDIASKNAGPETASRADYLYEKGALDQKQHLSILDSVSRAQAAQSEDDKGLSMADEAYKSGTKLDPKDQYVSKAMNLYFEELTNGQKPGSAGYVNMAESMADKTGIIPHDVVSYSRAQLLSGQPADAAAAAQMLDRLQRVNPRAYNDGLEDNGLKAMAHTINSAVSAGTDPVIAVNLARETAKRANEDTDLLDKQWKASQNSSKDGTVQIQSDVSAIRKGLADDPHYADQGLLSHVGIGDKVPTPSLAMTAEFQDLTREYFNHTGGNMQQARQLALNDLKGVWGVSEVNGDRQLMKYAPERMFPGLTADMVRGDVRTAVPDAQDPHLVESPETAVTGGKNWYIATKDQFGAYDVARDKDGMPMRYQLPTPTAAMVHAAADKKLKDQQILIAKQKEKQMESETALGNAELGNE